MEHQSFDGLGLAPQLVALVNKLGITSPTPIQHQAIPVAITGSDVVGIAQTGTGKTFAFGLPMIERLARNKKTGLVLLPTRELALQVEENLRAIGGKLGMNTAVLIGGASMYAQKQKLRGKVHVIIATPGRLVDHLNQRTVNLSNVGVLVLDEADRMFDMGFAPQLNAILGQVPKERQTMLFSTTMPDNVMNIARVHMKTPVRIEVAPQGTTAEKVAQEIIIVAKNEKSSMLNKVVGEHDGSVLVFSRTKHGAKKIAKSLRDAGFTSGELHANLSLNQRKASLEAFKSGKSRVLVATDIAARGVDVKGLELVVNYDLPDNPEDYVHRIGRTGRAGKAGRAVSFMTPDQKGMLRDIERLIGKAIPSTKTDASHSEPTYVKPAQRGFQGGRKPFGNRPPQRASGQRPQYGYNSRPSNAPKSAPSAPAAKAAPRSNFSATSKPRRVFIED